MNFFSKFISALMVVGLITVLPLLLGVFGLILSLLLCAVVMAGGMSEAPRLPQRATTTQGNNFSCKNYIRVETMNVQNNHGSESRREVVGLIDEF